MELKIRFCGITLEITFNKLTIWLKINGRWIYTHTHTDDQMSVTLLATNFNPSEYLIKQKNEILQEDFNAGVRHSPTEGHPDQRKSET
jgi:hypothetical protein